MRLLGLSFLTLLVLSYFLFIKPSSVFACDNFTMQNANDPITISNAKDGLTYTLLYNANGVQTPYSSPQAAITDNSTGTTVTTVTLTPNGNLPDGNYTFQALGEDKDGQVVDNCSTTAYVIVGKGGTQHLPAPNQQTYTKTSTSQQTGKDPGCYLKTDPDPITVDDGIANFTITSVGGVLLPNQEYIVGINDWLFNDVSFPVRFKTDDKGTLGIVDAPAYIANRSVSGDTFSTKFFAKRYDIRVYEVSPNPVIYNKGPLRCTVSFTPAARDSDKNADCSISYINKTFTPNDEISFTLSGTKNQNKNDQRRIILKSVTPSGTSDKSFTCQDMNQPFTLGKLGTGDYKIEVQTGLGIGLLNQLECSIQKSTVLCSVPLTICPTCTSASTEIAYPIPTPPCANGKFVNGQCQAVDTALGNIDVNPQEFIKAIFAILLGLGGGIAVLLIIYSGYRMVMSQGNPEAIQGARETITSAVVGLIFTIFSLVILEIIGVDILKIPGFNQTTPPTEQQIDEQFKAQGYCIYPGDNTAKGTSIRVSRGQSICRDNAIYTCGPNGQEFPVDTCLAGSTCQQNGNTASCYDPLANKVPDGSVCGDTQKPEIPELGCRNPKSSCVPDLQSSTLKRCIDVSQ